MDNRKLGTSSSGKEYSYYSVKGDKHAIDFFEFVAENSKVEWGYVKYEKDNNYITTTNIDNYECVATRLAKDWEKSEK